MPKAATANRKPPRTKRAARRQTCYQGWRKSGLYRNMLQVAAGYREAGLPGVAAFVDAVRLEARPDLTMGDLLELREVAMTLCVNAIFVLAELGRPEWIERRETHLTQMTATGIGGVVAGAAAVRKVMKFAGDPPAEAKRVRKKTVK